MPSQILTNEEKYDEPLEVGLGEQFQVQKNVSGDLFGRRLAVKPIGTQNEGFKADSQGIYLGHDTFASAPFSVNMKGVLKAYSVSEGGEKRVVDSADNIQSAIDEVSASGGGEVVLKDGTYVLTDDINIKDNVLFRGTSENSAVLYFIGNYGVKAVGSDAYSTGTISATNGSAVITGAGTTWSTNLVAGYYMRISGFWYEIKSVDSDTQVTLVITYGQSTVAGESYISANMISHFRIKDFTITNSAGSGYGVQAQYACFFFIDEVTMVSNNIGVDHDDIGHFSFQNITVLDSTSHGCDLINVSYGNGLTNYFASNGGDGIRLTGSETTAIVFSDSILEGNTSNGLYVADGSSIGFRSCTFSGNGDDGIELNSNTSDCLFTGSEIKDNGGYGVNIVAGTCNRTIISANVFNNNTTAGLIDNGTSTSIRGNLGVDDNSINTVASTKITLHTRTNGAGVGSQNLAHGLGSTPRYARITADLDLGANDFIKSVGGANSRGGVARSADDYITEILIDDCSGVPDNWSDSNASNSFAGGIMTVVDASALSGYIYKDTGNTDANWYFEIRMRYTAIATNNPALFQIRDTANWGGKAIARVVIDRSDGSLKAINGGADTDTGVDLAADTWTTIKAYGNTTTGKYKLDIDGTEFGEYDGETGATGLIESLVIGGGGSTSQWTYEVDYIYLKDGLDSGENSQYLSSDAAATEVGQKSGSIIYLYDGANKGEAQVTSMDTTNIVINWTTAPSATANLLLEVWS